MSTILKKKTKGKLNKILFVQILFISSLYIFIGIIFNKRYNHNQDLSKVYKFSQPDKLVHSYRKMKGFFDLVIRPNNSVPLNTDDKMTVDLDFVSNKHFQVVELEWKLAHGVHLVRGQLRKTINDVNPNEMYKDQLVVSVDNMEEDYIYAILHAYVDNKRWTSASTAYRLKIDSLTPISEDSETLFLQSRSSKIYNNKGKGGLTKKIRIIY